MKKVTYVFSIIKKNLTLFLGCSENYDRIFILMSCKYENKNRIEFIIHYWTSANSLQLINNGCSKHYKNIMKSLIKMLFTATF